ncbi:MAG TPA: hypothetical protein V6D08_12125, partial [Candidatus Obscuribacterales bacterium]
EKDTMPGTVIFKDGNQRLVRDGDSLVAEVVGATDSTGAPQWVPAPPQEVESILRGAVLNLDDRLKDRDQEDYDRAEAEARRRARENQRW